MRYAVIPTALILAGCATQQVAKAPEKTPVSSRPRAPYGASDNFVTPPLASDGRYATINHGIGEAETIWHLRAALNVAALGCRGAAEKSIIASYNTFLERHKKALATAYAAEKRDYRDRQAGGGARGFDAHMTRVYNFFAQPPAQAQFCREAAGVSVEAASVSRDGLQAFAQSALPRLEAPFTQFYRAYDDYRRALAAWEARQGRHGAGHALAARPADSGNWRLQLGAFSDTASAADAWSRARGRIVEFARLQPRYVPVPDKKLVRLQAGPVSDKATADRLCATATAAGQGCIPVGPAL